MTTQTAGEAAGTPSRSWLDTERLAVRADIEITEGLNDEPLAYDPANGHYTRLSRSGAAILKAIDGSMTGREFAFRAVRADGPGAGGNAEQVVLDFLGELRAAGLLTVPPAHGREEVSVKFARNSHMPRRPLVGPAVNSALDPVVTLLRRAPRVFGALWAAAAIGSLTAAGAVLASPAASDGPSLSTLGWGWALIVCLMVVQTVLHELSHAVACRLYDVRVREIGIGLLFYVVPAAYVDRTDAYRLRTRGPRVVIALAGVALDVLWLGGWSLLALTAQGWAAHLAVVVVWLQLGMLLANLNPLLPTDGYHALEAGFGAVNLRSRALTALRCRFLRQTPPSWLAARSRSQRVRYQVFGLVCLVYGLVIAAFCLRSLVLLAGWLT
ncbi:site-2 protease family protein [Streptomyces sp. NPDC006879]|uniref:site-2 protease family protein n=1 Tax=Streptomyces sp. NPDC006879 TaxID=3364767 RepID=UPI0036C03B24